MLLLLLLQLLQQQLLLCLLWRWSARVAARPRIVAPLAAALATAARGLWVVYGALIREDEEREESKKFGGPGEGLQPQKRDRVANSRYECAALRVHRVP